VTSSYSTNTAMKQAERRLQEAEAKYRSLVESASDLVWQVDREGRWQFVNRTCEQIYGVPANSLLGNRFTEVVDPEYLERDLAAFQQVLDGKELTDYETVHRDSRGESRHLSFSARPLLDEDGVVVGASGIARDVTERAAVRAALEAARREAERTAVAKSAFLANMSHEIRTPLNGILGMVELLLDTSLDHEQRRAAELVRESGQALLTVINDILDFSKIEAGRMELEQAEFDLHALVNSTARLLGVRCYERGLELVCEVQAEVPHRVLGDPGRIRQVLNNLVSNAVKFTHDGEVAVTASLERLGGDTAWVRISVRDTGIGIPEEKQEAVFEEFTQVDVTTTRQYGGTGLGLAISRRLVTLLGGSLGLRSEPGRGSEFSFTVPLRVVAGDGPAVTRRPEASLEGVRLLIIDDNSTNRRITGDMLRSAGAVVQEAESARAGLAALRRARGEGAPYQVAILDGHMPEMDGFALAREIKTDPALAATRLMMLTSAGQPGDGQRCRDLGITGYLSKPASRAELLETLGAVLKDTPHPEHATLITRHLISESRQPVRVLVVEDNPVNQQVAAAMLRKRGHAVTIAENGQEALDALRAAAFDVVLMDVQMPVMDGLTATRAIRADPGLADLPVVAMTAHALQEEQQHCRDAGMSAYLAKPFKPHELFAAVEGWQARPATTPPAAADDPDAPVDLARFRAAMRDAGVEDAVETMLDVFLRDAPTRMAALASAIERADAREIEATAHAFKSASGTIGAGRLANLLKTAEFAGRNGQPGRAAETLNALTSEYDAVMTYLSTVTGRRGTSHA
jgi:two-component system, sensor histidine kinase and response regulator